MGEKISPDNPESLIKESHSLDADANEGVMKILRGGGLSRQAVKGVVGVEQERPGESAQTSRPEAPANLPPEYRYGWRRAAVPYRPSSYTPSNEMPAKLQWPSYDRHARHGGRLHDSEPVGYLTLTDVDGNKINKHDYPVEYREAEQAIYKVNEFLDGSLETLSFRNQQTRKKVEEFWDSGSLFDEIPVRMHSLVVMNVVNQEDRRVERLIKENDYDYRYYKKRKKRIEGARETAEIHSPRIHFLIRSLHKISNLSTEVALGLIRWGEGESVIKHLDSFADEFSLDDVAKDLIKYHQVGVIAKAGRYDLIEQLSPELKEKVIKSLTRKEKAQLKKHVQ